MGRKTLQGQYSGFTSRASAFILDAAFISLTILMIYWLSSQLLLFFTGIQVGSCMPLTSFSLFAIVCHASTWLLNSFALGFPLLYILFFWVLAGQTPGKRLMGIRVVRLNGRRMNLMVGIRRLFGYVACYLSLGLGFLWVLIDDRRQGWHDKFAGTCVVYSWEVVQDEDFLMRASRRIQLVEGKQAAVVSQEKTELLPKH